MSLVTINGGNYYSALVADGSGACNIIATAKCSTNQCRASPLSSGLCYEMSFRKGFTSTASDGSGDCNASGNS